MPELPEVETIKNILIEKGHIIGKTISSIDVFRSQNLLNDKTYFVNSLIGSTVTKMSRVGKFLIFHFDNKKVMISHLRMEGKFFIKKQNDVVNKHDIVSFNFSDGTSLRYNDTRKFGILGIRDEDDYLVLEPINKVGPEPFSLEDGKRLFEAYKNKNIAIKTMLLDQSIMSGLGNIYCDEVLYQTKIHPETLAKDITKQQCDELVTASVDVLNRAIKQGGSTIHSYHPAEGVSGEFQVSLKVYDKENEPCLRCKTPYVKIFVNGRGTTYCPHCQKNVSLPKIIGVTGPVGAGKSYVSSLLSLDKYKIFDADKIVHSLYEDKNYAYKMAKSLRIKNIIQDDKIDRNVLRNYLIDNPSKKEKVNAYVWKSVKEVIMTGVKKMKHNDVAILDVPLLFESGLNYVCDSIVLVIANEEKQIEHLLYRNASTNLLKINEGYNLNEKKQKANYIIENNGSLNELKNKVKEITKELSL